MFFLNSPKLYLEFTCKQIGRVFFHKLLDKLLCIYSNIWGTLIPLYFQNHKKFVKVSSAHYPNPPPPPNYFQNYKVLVRNLNVVPRLLLKPSQALSSLS